MALAKLAAVTDVDQDLARWTVDGYLAKGGPVLFVRRLLEAGLSPGQVARVLGVVDELCPVCLDAELGACTTCPED